MSCNKCYGVLKTKGIDSEKAYRKWAVAGGHPDKGGNSEVFKSVVGCEQDFFVNKKCDWNYWEGYNRNVPIPPQRPIHKQRKSRSPKQRKPRSPKQRKPRSLKPCKPGYERSSYSKNKCLKKCKPGQIRSSHTGRCQKRRSYKAKSPKPCKSGYEKNFSTGKCRKSCKPGQVRNSRTGRCRNVST